MTQKMRVFELARELNMPAKQLIQKMITFGIVAESNFKGLSEKEIAFIKAKLSETASLSPTEGATRRGRVIHRAQTNAAADAEPEETSQKKPRRIRKSKREESESVETLAEAPATAVPFSEEAAPHATPLEKEEIAEKPARHIVKKDALPKIEQPPTEELPPEPQAETPVGTQEQKPTPEEKFPSSEVVEKASAPPPSFEIAPSALEAQESEQKKAVEFVDFDNKKTTGKELKRDKKTTRHQKEHESFAQGRFKKQTKKIHVVLSSEEGESWERSQRKRSRRNRHKGKAPAKQKHTFNPRKKSIKIGAHITVGELAGQIGIKATDIIKKLMGMGVMATINQSISGENAALIASEFNIEVKLDNTQLEDVLVEEEVVEKLTRAPIVTIMGHVDHGKTSLLDKIRTTQVTEGEAGGITQHIGAYRVETAQGDITFLDTPGHEAFTAMRARGANVTDIVILVVAADDGVQPQTIEAIHHAQAAEVPIIVVINKIDRPEANPIRIQQELLKHGLVSEDFGGETIFVQASAKSGEGLGTLLEMVHLQAEVLELQAPVAGRARGVIVESKISKGLGPVGTVLIQQGTLAVGDYYVVGGTFGKVRALFDDKGQALEHATPATPAEVLGFNSVPITGEEFIVLDDEKTARQIAENRASKSKDEGAARQQKMHLENLFSRISAEEQVVLNILIKADVHGSVEALQSSLTQLGNDQVSVRFLHTGTGTITENDVLLASASDAIILGFNTTIDANAKFTNTQEQVDIRLYSVIYDAIEDVKKALEGLLKPILRDEVIGRCEVRQIFNASKTGQILGCYVTEGKLLRDALIRIFRQEDVIHQGDLLSLKRFKDDVREVLNNYECGVVVDTYEAQVGDVIEAYIQVEESARL